MPNWSRSRPTLDVEREPGVWIDHLDLRDRSRRLTVYGRQMPRQRHDAPSPAMLPEADLQQRLHQRAFL